MNINGFQVVVDPHLTKQCRVMVRRTFWERLWSLHWFTTHKVSVINVPSQEFLIMDNKLIIHPETLKEVLRKFKEAEIGHNHTQNF